jgi:spore germination cell wall hydrolase CwlJ-like protein
MFGLRNQRRLVRFGVSCLTFAILPNHIGYQDLGALIARQPSVTQRWRAHVIASPFGTIHAATFSLPRPLGAAMPTPLYVRASVDPNDVAAALGRDPLGEGRGPLQFPSVNRKAKSDAAIARKRAPLPPLAVMATLPPGEVVPPADGDAQAAAPESNLALSRFNEYELLRPLPEQSATPDVDLPYLDLPPADLTKLAPPDDGEGNAARLYFGIDPFGSIEQAMSPWAPGAAPVILGQDATRDPDIKLSALTAPGGKDRSTPGESVANKGVVTGVDQRPQSPAERLKLSGASRAKAEKCLANAVYFESRGEPVRGQIAVAQVVMNRVFSPFYPDNVCDVVYQNAHRHLACQFTFACDGIPDVVTEPDMWVRAKRIARDMLDGKLWLPEIAKSTHYHAYWVRPSWVGEMRKILRLGVHTFYRPRNWGDGSDEPKWGDAKTTAEIAAKL